MDRLILIDREVAFLPADKDGSVAIEIRHPAIVTYLCTAFDRFWGLAPPMYLRTADLRSVNGVTSRQRAIAQLLTEGRTDAAIAARRGMHVRTAGVHSATQAAPLGRCRGEPCPGRGSGRAGRGRGPSGPAWAMRTPNWVRLAAPRVSESRAMCARQVRTLMPSRSAMTASWWPSASSAAMDCSRCEMP